MTNIKLVGITGRARVWRQQWSSGDGLRPLGVAFGGGGGGDRLKDRRRGELRALGGDGDCLTDQGGDELAVPFGGVDGDRLKDHDGGLRQLGGDCLKDRRPD